MEVWKDVVDNPKYEVSSIGRVRRKGKQDCLKINYQCTGGYGRVSIGKVHQLVAYAFIGIRPNGMDIDHINGNNTDNRVENLEYVTKSENCRRACNEQLSRNLRRENHNRAKLNQNKVIEIKLLLKKGIKNKEIVFR